MVLPLLLGGPGLTIAGKLYEEFDKKKDKKKKKAYEAGKAAGMAQAGMENVGGGAGMSVNRKKGGKAGSGSSYKKKMKMKIGGSMGSKPRGVGCAQRGYGKAMK